MRVERWLTVAGFGTWLVSALPTIATIVDGRMSPEAIAVWATAFVAFGVAFGLMCLRRPGIWHLRAVRVACLAVQTCSGLVMTASSGDVFPAVTLVVVAGQLDEFML